MALVTGASRGIGRALAIELTAAGIFVTGVGRDVAELTATASLCADGRFTPVAANVTDAAALSAVFATANDLDLCFVNAGVGHQEDFADIAAQRIRELFDVNVFGALTTMQLAARAMVPRGRGRIVVVGSDAAYRGIAGMASYVASKHALLGLACSLQLELDGTGVNLTIVHPGPVRTGILGEISAQGGGMEPRDVARLIVESVLLPSLRSVELRLHPGATT